VSDKRSNRGNPHSGPVDFQWRLAEWRLQNFKSVADATVRLGGLTLLVGANSAGKSSLIQSILLFKQAQGAEHERQENFPLNGAFVRLGSFEDVLHDGVTSTSARVALGGTLLEQTVGSEIDDPRNAEAECTEWDTCFGPPLPEHGGRMRVELSSLRALTWEASVAPGDDSEAQSGDDRVPRRFEVVLERKPGGKRRWHGILVPVLVSVLRGRESRGARPLPLGDYTGRLTDNIDFGERTVRLLAGSPDRGLPAVGLRGTTLGQAVNAPCLYGISNAEWRKLEVQGQKMFDAYRTMSSLRGVGPDPGRREKVAEQADEIAQEMAFHVDSYRDVEEDGIGPDCSPKAAYLSMRIGEGAFPLVAPFSPSAHFGRVELPRAIRSHGIDFRVLVEPDADAFRPASERVRNFFRERVAYLGPLRSTPRSLPGAYVAQDGVGVEGEFTAALLHAEKDTLVAYEPAGAEPWDKTIRLVDAVSHWLQKLGIAESVTSTDRGRDGIEISVRPFGVGRDLNLRNVGVGTNQILPVVVLCLTSRPGSLILLEQPELHLHPAAQQALADFLLAMVKSGRQILVETHGEHLLGRLRRRIAEDDNDSVLDDLRVLFAERNIESGVTTYRSVEPNVYGGIDQWPQGFFDQGPRESAEILEAAIRKRTKRT